MAGGWSERFIFASVEVLMPAYMARASIARTKRAPYPILNEYNSLSLNCQHGIREPVSVCLSVRLPE